MQQQQRTWVMAAAGTMESCAMILRGVHPWRLARPSKPSVLGCIQLPCAKAAGSSDHTSDQRSCSILWLFLLCWWRNILYIAKSPAPSTMSWAACVLPAP